MGRRLLLLWQRPPVLHLRLHLERARVGQGAPALELCADGGPGALRTSSKLPTLTLHAFAAACFTVTDDKQTSSPPVLLPALLHALLRPLLWSAAAQHKLEKASAFSLLTWSSCLFLPADVNEVESMIIDVECASAGLAEAGHPGWAGRVAGRCALCSACSWLPTTRLSLLCCGAVGIACKSLYMQRQLVWPAETANVACADEAPRSLSLSGCVEYCPLTSAFVKGKDSFDGGLGPRQARRW